jgi:radical SAM protein with 4Fe4S-binding SPASM domain
MADIIQARDLRGARTERLIDSVPLPAPWTMFIEPTNACNYRCQYCPTGHPDLLTQVGRRVTLMRWELFTKVVDDMKQFPRKCKMVNLYKDGESLIHPQFIEMVQYLKRADVTERIWLKTNGQLLKPELNEQLISCGLDMIGVSVQAPSAQGFYEIAGVRIDYEHYRDGVLDLYRRSRGTPTRISAKIADVGQSEGEKRRFINDFEDRCDAIAVEGLHGWASSDAYDFRLGTDQSFDGSPRTAKIACPLVLYMLTVNANGDISVCNDDWQHTHQIGNAAHMGLMDIWRGERLKQFRMTHLLGHRAELAACGTCDYVQALPDNIDADRASYIERLR